MPIIRVESRERFTSISNQVFNDHSLTLQAKGLLCYLLSRPDNWQVNVEHLRNTCSNGRDAIYSVLEELIGFGYITRQQKRTASGKASGYLYTVFEKPFPNKPFPEKPETEIPTLIKTDSIVNTEKNSSEEKIKNAKISFCKRLIDFATKNPAKYPKLLYFEFAKFWLEQNETATKMRFQDQKFFEVGRRLATWLSKSDNKLLSDQWQAETKTETINALLRKLL